MPLYILDPVQRVANLLSLDGPDSFSIGGSCWIDSPPVVDGSGGFGAILDEDPPTVSDAWRPEALTREFTLSPDGVLVYAGASIEVSVRALVNVELVSGGPDELAITVYINGSNEGDKAQVNRVVTLDRLRCFRSCFRVAIGDGDTFQVRVDNLDSEVDLQVRGAVLAVSAAPRGAP